MKERGDGGEEEVWRWRGGEEERWRLRWRRWHLAQSPSFSASGGGDPSAGADALAKPQSSISFSESRKAPPSSVCSHATSFGGR